MFLRLLKEKIRIFLLLFLLLSQSQTLTTDRMNLSFCKFSGADNTHQKPTKRRAEEMDGELLWIPFLKSPEENKTRDRREEKTPEISRQFINCFRYSARIIITIKPQTISSLSAPQSNVPFFALSITIQKKRKSQSQESCPCCFLPGIEFYYFKRIGSAINISISLKLSLVPSTTTFHLQTINPEIRIIFISISIFICLAARQEWQIKTRLSSQSFLGNPLDSPLTVNQPQKNVPRKFLATPPDHSRRDEPLSTYK